VREDGRIVGGEAWQEKINNIGEWKKLLRTARNHRILHMPKERMNERVNPFQAESLQSSRLPTQPFKQEK